uniref:NADH-ubiquinone oxidoreductase chain 6 n=1 Tax=Acanthocepola krusensternii TaxID=270597 RepID=A0A1V1FH95_9TELE|nr:NADH dehydrogenase subunit 6 [Acanthocepola krusensternii]BAX03667.1 NADH dehydrogenase subunit 6 [Acanthocepola krusensternii]BBU26032.1 NADH dehydrogenase subunit 6 [Acanthocepola krusensternii]
MTYIMTISCWGLVGGMIGVASNPSPHFAALGLVVAAGFGCGVLAGSGAVFLSLVLLLIYLGGMLVVFAYSVALAAEPYPESWGNKSVRFLGAGYIGGVCVMAGCFWEWWAGYLNIPVEGGVDMYFNRADTLGASLLYKDAGGLLLISGIVLLLVLFVVLELTRGMSRGALRAV